MEYVCGMNLCTSAVSVLTGLPEFWPTDTYCMTQGSIQRFNSTKIGSKLLNCNGVNHSPIFSDYSGTGLHNYPCGIQAWIDRTQNGLANSQGMCIKSTKKIPKPKAMSCLIWFTNLLNPIPVSNCSHMFSFHTLSRQHVAAGWSPNCCSLD